MSQYFVRTFKRRKAFLDALASGDSISSAARSAGGTPRDFKSWRNSDEDFAKDWDDAIEEGTDYIEDEAVRRALKKSDPLMAMMLKARRPEKFDRGSKLELSGGISVEGAKSKLLNRIARLQAQGAMVEGGPPSLDALPGLNEADGKEEIKQIEAPRPEPSSGPGPRRGSKRRAAAGLSD